MTNFRAAFIVCYSPGRKNEKLIFNRQINNFYVTFTRLTFFFSLTRSLFHSHFDRVSMWTFFLSFSCIFRLLRNLVLPWQWRNYLLFTIDFHVNPAHRQRREQLNQRNLLKSILREEINPLINRNRFTIPFFPHFFFKLENSLLVAPVLKTICENFENFCAGKKESVDEGGPGQLLVHLSPSEEIQIFLLFHVKTHREHSLRNCDRSSISHHTRGEFSHFSIHLIAPCTTNCRLFLSSLLFLSGVNTENE